jgi:hypothetical protein
VAFTDSIWTHPSPPDELVAWWRGEYPAITDEHGVRRAVTGAGFDTVGFFTLPPASWWDEYYAPMEPTIDAFRSAHPGDQIAEEIAAKATQEIEMFRRFSNYYSYGFFIVQPTAATNPAATIDE